MSMRMSLKSGLAAAALLSTPVVAGAADAVRPARLPAYYDWTGFYAGGHVGFGSTGDSDSGILGGGQAGLNYQIGRWVLGVEGELAAASKSFNWLSTVSGRAGYTFDRWLVYGKVGGAWANVDDEHAKRGRSSDHTSSGLLLGVGAEYVLQNNWTVKFEYNRMDIDHTADVFKVGLNYRFGLGPLPGPGRR